MSGEEFEAWLERFYALLDERLTTSWVGVVTPIATVVLAIASVVVAVMSWRTANRATELSEEHWKTERHEAALGRRRVLAVDIKEWYSGEILNAHANSKKARKELDRQRDRLRRDLQRGGEDLGERLVRMLVDKAGEYSRTVGGLTGTEYAEARRPYRIRPRTYSQNRAIDSWVADPESVRQQLDEYEATRLSTMLADIKSSGAPTPGGPDERRK
ncbi:hypothetical protein ACFVAJ_20835 [Agromyces sp. NPDC057679]|uniref:hypothetical protein n=1 Tax=Agromyces sp. NPDC057679 TaxID=3346207 RepID=UPI003671D4C3